MSGKSEEESGVTRRRKEKGNVEGKENVTKENEGMEKEEEEDYRSDIKDNKIRTTFFTRKDKLFSVSIEIDVPSIALFIVALVTRVYRLEQPRSVVFDELHYVKYASLYASNTFFFDSQPPLGKQIISLVAYLSGFNNKASLERIGGEYDPSVPIFALRLVPAVFGSLLVPTAYRICLLLGLSQATSTLAALLMVLDTAMLTQSRYVLMESILMFFALFGLFCLLKFRQLDRTRWFGPGWWAYLCLSAVSFSCALCVKYVGGLSLLLGVYILVRDMWYLLEDNSLSDLGIFMHGFLRACVYSVIPVTVYLLVFHLHLSILTKAGPHDTIMTSAFQASLEGGLASITKGQPTFIAHGSQVTLRHSLGRTCWLHSHTELYPLRYPDGRGSSHQQQVTCYSYKDVNNWWIVKRPHASDVVVEEPIDKIKHGDIVQLVHGISMRMLNSHDVASPMSPALQEVSCYIDYNITKFPPHTTWKVDILNRDTVGDFWITIHSQVRLVHVDSGQALKFSGKQLPDWGFNQHEVVTDRVVDQDDTIWNVEEHRYTKKKDEKERELDLVTAEFVPLEPTKLSFWQKLAELQYKMFIADNENVEDHMFSSDPLEWPFLTRGIAYWVSHKSNAQIFLLGNPILWWTGTLAIPTYLALLGFCLLRRRRLCYDIPEDMFRSLLLVGEVLVGGYLLHYIPFFFLDKSLFLHHYLPASVFKVILIAALIQQCDHLIDFMFRDRHPWVSSVFYAIVFSWLLAVSWSAWTFSVFSYGTFSLSSEEIDNLRWFHSWAFILHK